MAPILIQIVGLEQATVFGFSGLSHNPNTNTCSYHLREVVFLCSREAILFWILNLDPALAETLMCDVEIRQTHLEPIAYNDLDIPLAFFQKLDDCGPNSLLWLLS